MNVNADHLLQALAQRFRRAQPGVRGGLEELPNGMKQEASGAAGGIKNALFERGIDGLGADPGRQPIWREILAEVVPLIGIDQGLIKTLQNIVPDIIEAKARDLAGDSRDQVRSRLRLQHPIEKVRFDCAVNPCLMKGPPR
jgi:hypothetical protein